MPLKMEHLTICWRIEKFSLVKMEKKAFFLSVWDL